MQHIEAKIVVWNSVLSQEQFIVSFITYSQNFEDLVLFRALKHVEAGFYIDIGAQDPNIESVTRAFYERGWNGINVDASPLWVEKLAAERPRDINIARALGEEKGHAKFYEVANSGLSTLDPQLGNKYSQDPNLEVTVQSIELDTLANLVQTYEVRECHFLKIDVEGAELAVLKGTDLSTFRPWIVVVESTRPLSTTEAHAEWEPILLNAGYIFCYFDGLNRFYVAKEKEHLSVPLSIPPNIFDDFKTIELIKTVGEVSELYEEARKDKEQIKELTESLRFERDQRAALYNSLSWRITAPVRATYDFLFAQPNRNDSKPGLTSKLLDSIASFILNRPKLLDSVLSVVRKYPTLYRLLQRRYGAASAPPIEGSSYWEPPKNLDEMSPRGRRILHILKEESGSGDN